MKKGIQKLEWDTQFFGVPIGRVVGPISSAKDMSAVDHDAKILGFGCVYFLSDLHPAEVTYAAEDVGFRLVDIRVTFETDLSPSRPYPTPSCTWLIRKSKPSDLEKLGPLAARSHTDSRFFADLRFDRKKCAELYQIWIQKSLENPSETVFVSDWNQTASGYLTQSILPDQTGVIGLVGIHEALRGKGAGKAMISHGLDWFKAQGVLRAEVVTQGRNVAAQRLYESQGFRIKTIQTWFHKWYF